MNKKMGYSIRYRDDSMVAVGVSREDDGRWRIDDLEQNQAAAGPSPDLARSMSDSGVSLTVVAPGSEVKTALTSLPRLKKKELNLAARGWVAREESSPADQWQVSWSQRAREHGQEDKNRTDIFLLYSSLETMNGYLKKTSDWGGQPSRMLPDFLILENMYRHHIRDEEALEGWNVVFVGKDDQFLCVSTPTGLLMTRSLPADLSEGQNREEHLERLATEVDRSIFFARQTEYNPNIQRIVVCGERDLAEGLVKQLSVETTVEVEFWDVASLFEWQGRELESSLFLPAMAAALAPEKSLDNLLPPKKRRFLNPAIQHKLVLAAATAAVVVLPLITVGGWVTQSIQDRYLDRAEQRLVDARYRAGKATDIYKAQKVLLAREEHIQTADRFRQDYAGVLLHLAALTPEEIIFQDLRIKETGDGRLILFLSGESQSDRVEVAQQSFLVFQKALNESQLLQTVGEPRKLIISAEKDQGAVVKKVEFSMEYKVRTELIDIEERPAVALGQGGAR